MDRAKMAELIETRENESPGDDVTLGRTHNIAFSEGYGGEMNIEYKPERYRLTEDAFAELADEGFFVPDYEELEDEPKAERMVSDMYWVLVDLLFPSSSYLDEPWTRLPLVVEVEYSKGDLSDYYASLGTYR